MPVDHYENFPVASLLLPAHLRRAVADIYRFARAADDIADEGDATDAQRLAVLARFRFELDRIDPARGDAPPPAPPPADPVGDLSAIFVPLADTLRRHALPADPLRRLLSAFEQDVGVKRYADFESLRHYCSRSADPVGETLLHLYGAATDDNLRHSAGICTGLQLVNFWQDVAIDFVKGRIYIPQEDLARFGVDEEAVGAGRVDAAWRALMAFEVERARALLHFGAPLALALPGRLGWELRLIVQGGLRILERIEAAGFDVFQARPTLRRRDWLVMAWRALRMTRR